MGGERINSYRVQGDNGVA